MKGKRYDYRGPATLTLPAAIATMSAAEIKEVHRQDIERFRTSKLDKSFEGAILVENYDSWICTWPEIGRSSQDGYFPSVDDCREWCAENDVPVPEFAFCCNSYPPQSIDYDDIVDNAFCDSFEEAYEHVSAKAAEEFKAAIDKFNKSISGILSYTIDFNRKVRVAE